jgi:hypothetical protein
MATKGKATPKRRITKREVILSNARAADTPREAMRVSSSQVAIKKAQRLPKVKRKPAAKRK